MQVNLRVSEKQAFINLPKKQPYKHYGTFPWLLHDYSRGLH